MKMKGRYSERGVVNEGFYEWKELEGFRNGDRIAGSSKRIEEGEDRLLSRKETTKITTESSGITLSRTLFAPSSPGKSSETDPETPIPAEPPWGHRHVLDICCLLHPLGPRISGDHAWLRLKHPDGTIISVGLYRPENRGYWQWLRFPFKTRTGALQSPDVSEFWGGQNINHVISIGITAEGAERIRQKIVKDREGGRVIYEVTHGNCIVYVLGFAALCGIRIPCTMPLEDILGYGAKGRTKKFAVGALSRVVGLLSGTLGEGEVEAALLDGEADPEKRAEILKRGKEKGWGRWAGMNFSHPWVVGIHVKREIEEWRAEKQEPLRTRLAELERQLDVVRTDVEVEWAKFFVEGTANQETEATSTGQSSTARHPPLTRPSIAPSAPARSVALLEDEVAKLKLEIDDISYDIPDKFRGPRESRS